MRSSPLTGATGTPGWGESRFRPSGGAKGLAGPMLRLVLIEAFSMPEFERLELGVFTWNTPAIKTYQRLGFTLEGVRPARAKAFSGVHRLRSVSPGAQLADQDSRTGWARHLSQTPVPAGQGPGRVGEQDGDRGQAREDLVLAHVGVPRPSCFWVSRDRHFGPVGWL
jgi:hypothetical protein